MAMMAAMGVMMATTATTSILGVVPSLMNATGNSTSQDIRMAMEQYDSVVMLAQNMINMQQYEYIMHEQRHGLSMITEMKYAFDKQTQHYISLGQSQIEHAAVAAAMEYNPLIWQKQQEVLQFQGYVDQERMVDQLCTMGLMQLIEMTLNFEGQKLSSIENSAKAEFAKNKSAAQKILSSTTSNNVVKIKNDATAHVNHINAIYTMANARRQINRQMQLDLYQTWRDQDALEQAARRDKNRLTAITSIQYFNAVSSNAAAAARANASGAAAGSSTVNVVNPYVTSNNAGGQEATMSYDQAVELAQLEAEADMYDDLDDFYSEMARVQRTRNSARWIASASAVNRQASARMQREQMLAFVRVAQANGNEDVVVMVGDNSENQNFAPGNDETGGIVQKKVIANKLSQSSSAECMQEIISGLVFILCFLLL